MVALAQGQDACQFVYPVTGPVGTGYVAFVLETDAFELLLTQSDAQALGLPNLGPLQVAGVGGASSAYRSQVTLSVGIRTFVDVACVVDPTFGQNPFGARLLIDHGWAILVDPVASTLTFLQA